MTIAQPFVNFNINASMVRSLCMVLCFVLVLSFAMVSTAQIGYCTEPTEAPSTNPEGIEALGAIGTTVASAIYQLIRSIITPCVCLAFAAAGLMFLFGGNQGTEKAKKIMLGACAGMILVVFAPVIGQFLGEQFQDQGSGDLSKYNPLD